MWNTTMYRIFLLESAATRKSKPGEQSETVSKTIPLENEQFNLCVQSCRPYVIQLWYALHPFTVYKNGL